MIPASLEVEGLSTNTVHSRWRDRLYFKALCIFYKFNILKGRAFTLRLWKWCGWSKQQLYRMLVPGHLCSVNKPRAGNVICALVLRCCLCWQNAAGISFQNGLRVSTPVASKARRRQRLLITGDSRGASCQPATVHSASNSRHSNTGGACSVTPASLRGSQGWRWKQGKPRWSLRAETHHGAVEVLRMSRFKGKTPVRGLKLYIIQ